MVEPDVVFNVRDGVGQVLLNRPRAINALTADMMLQLSAVLHAWADDPTVRSVVLEGAGPRGFCSGADVRQVRQFILDASPRALLFFEREYELNRLLSQYPKPVTARLHGISMGGGLGLAEHTRRRVAAPDLQWAMPEVTIGLFPDTGVLWELARTPGQVGAWLAMTGQAIDAASALWAGLVDEVEGDCDPASSQLAQDSGWVDECFVGYDASVIIQRLEQHDDERARATAALIRTRSPLSVCVALAGLRRAATAPDVAAVLRQDLLLVRSFMQASDFCEGVRAQLVDKDRNPRWWHSRVEDVPTDLVQAMFAGPDA